MKEILCSLFLLMPIIAFGGWRMPASSAQGVTVRGEHAKFLYQLADDLREEGSDEKKEKETSFDAGCMYSLDLRKMKLSLLMCEGYTGSINDQKLAKKFSDILLTYLPIHFNQIGERVAGGPWACKRPNPKSPAAEYSCEFTLK